MNKTSKATQEEEHATLALKDCMENEYKDSQQTYTSRMADTHEIYLALVDRELDHENIRKEGNIIDYERKTKVPSALHQKRVNPTSIYPRICSSHARDMSMTMTNL